jgi:hypothetical protein
VNNATVLETSGRFVVDGLVESPSLVREGPDIAIDALARVFDDVLALTGTAKTAVLAVGYAWPRQCRGSHLVERLNKLRPTRPGVASMSVAR